MMTKLTTTARSNLLTLALPLCLFAAACDTGDGPGDRNDIPGMEEPADPGDDGSLGAGACAIGTWIIEGYTDIGDCYLYSGTDTHEEVIVERDPSGSGVIARLGRSAELVDPTFYPLDDGCHAEFGVHVKLGDDYESTTYYEVVAAPDGTVSGRALMFADYLYTCDQDWEVGGSLQ